MTFGYTFNEHRLTVLRVIDLIRHVYILRWINVLLVELGETLKVSRLTRESKECRLLIADIE